MAENTEDVRGLKREITKLKREVKAAQTARNRDAEKLKGEAGAAKADAAQFKKESADRAKRLAGLEQDLKAAQSKADNLSKELDMSKEETSRLQQQVEAAKTSPLAAESTGSDDASPTSNPVTGKEDSTMSPQPDPAVEDQIVHYEHAKTAIKQQSRVKANQIVATYSAISAGVGIVPVAVIDIAGLAAVQLTMLSKLADAYGVKYSGNLGRTILSAILGSLIPTSLKVSTIGLIRSVPLFGPLLGLVTMPAYCWSVTYAIGTVFTELFERDGDLENLDVEDTKAQVKKVLASVSPKQAETAAKAA
ncbi:DUF697 domain-containing protein [Thalassobaculum sp. OXR-137]|uniref:DUF697 domain-containing protein n=1 Tax=Thalassobaculum sp. OXR-137 TaxID=3100173 RepID=UPI002AC92EA4|nr:DUF697 domain-containing protein [Thalassobaculum sp. OXR-137]WPZ32681.1 DUF697 domain-containing protein [Thalassobaculum sp. OXR-137]